MTLLPHAGETAKGWLTGKNVFSRSGEVWDRDP